jgi:galactose mutarotase-like enzyme
MQFLRTAAGDDILWHGDPEYWSGRAPILFPIVGRAVQDTIAVGEHHAEMKQHGFARRSEFTLEAHNELSCTYVLTETPESLAAYPFSFALKVTYRLDGPTVHISAQVTNHGDTDMPFGLGFHPAFSWPLPQSDEPHFVNLTAHASPMQHILHEGLLSPEETVSPFKNGELEIREDLFANDALVFPNGVEPLRYGPKQGTYLEFQFQNLPDLALWKPVNAPFLCIEPWHGTASYIGDGPQIADRPNSLILPAGETMEFGYSVTVRVGL